MKKILTVSLFAMMAVSAANADIASTKYVTDRTGTVSFGADTPMSDATDLTQAIVAVNAQINAMSGELSAGLQGSINELAGTVSDMDEAYKAADTALDGRLTTAEGKITTIEGQQTAQDGKITALETSLSATGTTGKAIADNATAIDAIKKSAYATSGVTSAVVNQVTTNKNDISAINNESTGILAQAKADAKSKADAAQSAAESKVTALQNGAVKTNTDNITTITTNLGGLNGVTIPAACQTGRCALVMEAGKAKWETING